MKRYQDPLFAPEKRRHPALGFLALLLVLVIAAALGFNHINNNRVNLIRQSVTVPSLPSAFETFRILHISDLHGLEFGAQQVRLRDTIANANYDIVCVTGDVTGTAEDVQAFLELLDLFSEKTPVYFIPGDEDPDPLLATPHASDSAKADYILAAEAHGAVYVDAPVKITKGSANLWLCPEWVFSLDADASETALNSRYQELQQEPSSAERDAALRAVEYQQDRLSRVRSARRETSESDLHIILTHHPLSEESLADLQALTRTDNDSYVRTIALVLAGHYVSGQWRIPGIGPVRVPESAGLGNNGWFPPDSAVTGLSFYLGIPQYISPGLGASAAIGLPHFRLLNTPAVTVLTLTTKMTH